jgi:hypothetical protein
MKDLNTVIPVGSLVHVSGRSKFRSNARRGDYIIVSAPRVSETDDGDKWTEYVGLPCYPDDELFGVADGAFNSNTILQTIDAATVDIVE